MDLKTQNQFETLPFVLNSKVIDNFILNQQKKSCKEGGGKVRTLTSTRRLCMYVYMHM